MAAATCRGDCPAGCRRPLLVARQDGVVTVAIEAERDRAFGDGYGGLTAIVGSVAVKSLVGQVGCFDHVAAEAEPCDLS